MGQWGKWRGRLADAGCETNLVRKKREEVKQNV